MQFEILKYLKAGKTDSLKSDWTHVNINFKKKEEDIKNETRKVLAQSGYGEIPTDLIEVDKQCGVIEILNQKGDAVIQLRSDD